MVNRPNRILLFRYNSATVLLIQPKITTNTNLTPMSCQNPTCIAHHFLQSSEHFGWPNFRSTLFPTIFFLYTKVFFFSFFVSISFFFVISFLVHMTIWRDKFDIFAIVTLCRGSMWWYHFLMMLCIMTKNKITWT